VAVPDIESAKSLKEIKDNIKIPLIADIHFDYKLAVESAKYADKLRINPGNIGSEEKIKAVVDAAKKHKIPIRIGVNLGSLEKDIEAKYGLTAKAMVESALKNIDLLEKLDFYDIVVSLKASDVLRTIEANRLFSKLKDYPLHLGITESGSGSSGTIKSSVGIGILISEGIGDTIRVSLSDNPLEEVKAAKYLLQSLKLRRFGIEITSCPICARANFDVAKVVKEIEEKTTKVKKQLHIAIMGCGVNGPGEAKEADIGVVGGKGENLFYRNGEIEDKIEDNDIIKKIMDEIEE
jgi:(E)-4-hydroxy-3-methylbut-2-enyl-diphosphate synthase